MQNDTNTNANTSTATVEAPAVAVAEPKAKPVIAIVAENQGLASAMKTILARTQKGCEFKVVSKISDAPAGSTIGNLGLPSYAPGSAPLKVLSFGTKMVRNQTTEQSRAIWTMLRDKESTEEQCLEALGDPDTCILISGRAATAVRAGLNDLRVAIAEAESVEDKLAATRAALNYVLEQIPLK